MGVIGAIALLLLTHIVITVAAGGPSVIIIGAGFFGISAAKTLTDAAITNIVILEATDRIGGRIHKTKFAGLNVDMRANWVEGVNGDMMNPIWLYGRWLKSLGGGLYKSSQVQKAIDLSESIHSDGENLKFSNFTSQWTQ